MFFSAHSISIIFTSLRDRCIMPSVDKPSQQRLLRRFKIMRIGLVSDTHIPRDAKRLPPHVKEAFKGVDLILHAGDIYIPSVLDELETIAPVLAARGNGDCDFPEDHRLKDCHIVDADGFRIGLTHATILTELPRRHIDGVLKREFGGHVDVIVYGDTHVAAIEKYEGVLLINPGSPTLPKGRFELGTVALLETNKGKIKARIVQLGEFQVLFQKESVYRRGFGA